MAGITINVDEFVDPFEATVVTTTSPDGQVEAYFDLSGLPRLDPALAGKPVGAVPDMVKHLCGICPVAHHLAGVAALEDLLGYRQLTPTAQAVRGFVAAAAQAEQLSRHLVGINRVLALEVKKAAKHALTAAGVPGHFPDIAIPGGVRQPVDRDLLRPAMQAVDSVSVRLAEFLEDHDRHASRTHSAAPPLNGNNTLTDSAQPPADQPVDSVDITSFGVGVRLVDEQGRRNILGSRVAITRPTALASPLLVTPAEFMAACRETRPGAPAPRPVVTLPDTGEESFYRVGPTAQYPHTTTARDAIIASLQDALDTLIVLSSDPDLTTGDTVSSSDTSPGQVGIGMVDGPRGLLVHVYRTEVPATVDTALSSCQILTPTAQNEPWLAWMLTASLSQSPHLDNPTVLEQPIRAADPCLPCTSAPPGAMGIQLRHTSS